LTPDPATKEFFLAKLHPYSSIDEARNRTGWNLKVSKSLEESLPPSLQELEVLRNQLDVNGEFTGWRRTLPASSASRKASTPSQ